MLTRIAAVQGAADAHERRALLGGYAVILARAHRELLEPEAVRQCSQAPEIRPRLLGVASERRHRREAADLDGHPLQERLQLVLRDPGLRSLAGQVDLQQSEG